MSASDGIAEIRAAETAVVRERGLRAQREVAQAHQSDAALRCLSARAELVGEQEDVAKLEGRSMARILATLTGDRETELARERAEVQAAEYAVAEAEERLRTANAELAAIDAQLADVGDVAAQVAAANALREQALLAGGGEVAERLSVLARTSGEIEAHQQQLAEATDAAHAALDRLQAAAELLGSAGSWAAWDTFGGGGLITDSIKYDRLDRAAELMRAADATLVRLARELADVGVAGVGGIEISQLTRTFDVWFDNIFSDWAVRDRIKQAADRVQQLIDWVRQLLEMLAGKTRQAAAELDAAEQERAGLRSF